MKNDRSAREPFLRLIKRDSGGLPRAVLVRAAAVIIAMIICGLFMHEVSGFSIGETYRFMFEGTFRNDITVNYFLKEACMLLLIAVALAPAFKMSFWNVGGQGQVLAGGLAAAMWLFYLGDTLSDVAILPLMIVSACLVGGLWALIPAIFRVKFTTNETLFTLMMNYIAIQLVACFTDIWRGRKTALGIITRKHGYFPSLFGNSNGWIYVIAVVSIVLMYVYMNKTKHGYEISVVGEAPNTARYAGINEKRVVLRTVFISGAICGLVGFLYVSALDHSISAATGGGYGFTAVIVAWLAKFNPIFMTLISILISFVASGSNEISNRNVDLNSSISAINIGVFLFFILGCEFFLNYKIVIGRKKSRTEKEKKA